MQMNRVQRSCDEILVCSNMLSLEVEVRSLNGCGHDGGQRSSSEWELKSRIGANIRLGETQPIDRVGERLPFVPVLEVHTGVFCISFLI
jgi:hypothetical protein